MKHFAVIMLATAAMTGAAIAQEATQEVGSAATASMMSADSKEMGQITFTQTKSGMLHVLVEMTGLPPGPHGFHIHETGQCDAAGGFESAGGHYAGGKEHGINSENGPHAGDFPNVHVGQDGVLKVEFFTDRLSLGEGGENPLADEDGSAVIVHTQHDDNTTHPTGDAGDRLACGVVEQPA